MSYEEENDYWNGSDVKPFNFDEDDPPINSGVSSSSPGTVKTLESILAAKSSSNEPFLKPSMIMCHQDRVEQLIDYLENKNPTRTNQTQKLDPRSCIIDIIDKKRPIDFSIYKSRREKLMLLDCAISSSDGDVITAVTVFISKTLKPSIVAEEFKRRPIASDHYRNYLEITGRVREAIDYDKLLSATTV